MEFSPLLPLLIQAGISPEPAARLWDRAIFALDAYQVSVACDAVVVNLNGRVPDEGAVVEAALAWRAGKVVVGYKDDLRSLYLGKDNPMLTGLFGFQVHNSFAAVAKAVQQALDEKPTVPTEKPAHPDLLLGEKIWTALQSEDGFARVAGLLSKKND